MTQQITEDANVAEESIVSKAGFKDLTGCEMFEELLVQAVVADMNPRFIRTSPRLGSG
jgi:hypothetical protein